MKKILISSVLSIAFFLSGIAQNSISPKLGKDPVKKVIAASHAGWRGTCANISKKTVQKLTDNYHCDPSDIRVVIGPSISANVYEVGKEVVDNFQHAGFDISEIVSTKNNSSFLDLWKANQHSLEEAGILRENIEISGYCTFTEHDRFFSARRLGIKSGRMLSGIMLLSTNYTN